MESFARYEFKYVLPCDDAKRIVGDVGQFMVQDPHIQEKKSNAYLVRSLYFDTSRFANFYEKIDGIKKRHKYRVRTYSQQFSPEIPVYVERKERNNNRVMKYREQLTAEDIRKLSRNALGSFHGDCGEVTQQFGIEVLRRQLRPKVIVQYQRQPFISYHDGQFRVTFDSELFGVSSEHLWDRVGEIARWAPLLPGNVIMELKFNRRIPAWFHRIIQAYGLDRVSISKYVLGVSRLRLATNLS